jgi:hypothetical protein
VGFETSGDVAEYQLNAHQAVIATMDFSCPLWTIPSILEELLSQMHSVTCMPKMENPILRWPSKPCLLLN